MSLAHFLLYTILFLLYTMGLWERCGLSFAPIVLELLVWGYLFVNWRNWQKNSAGGGLLSALVITAVFTGIITESFGAMLKHIRFYLYFVLIVRSLWYEEFTVGQFKKLLWFVLFLFVANGAGAAVQSFVIGDRIEGYVGLMSVLGGTTATVWPTLLCSVALLVYMFLTPGQAGTKSWYWILFLVFLSAAMVAFGSVKRAVFIFAPLLMCCAAGISFFWLPWRRVLCRKLPLLLLLILAVNGFILSAIMQTKGFNYALSGDESWLQTMRVMREYSREYAMSESYSGTTGREGTSMVVLDKLFEDYSWLTGVEYHAHKDDDVLNERGVRYGIVGWSRDALCGGMILMLLTVWLYLALIFSRRTPEDGGFWPALKWVLALNFLLIYFLYSSDYVGNLKSNMFMAILIVLANSPGYGHIRLAASAFLDTGGKTSDIIKNQI